MNKEHEFLNIIANSLQDSSYLGDDCAYLDECKLAISTDSLIEDVHFSHSLMSVQEIAKKALLVNISDILASGANPNYALISLGGNLNEQFVQNFYKGINEIANKFNIKIVGGDLVKSDKTVINITILGDYKNRNKSSRYNAKKNYIVAVVGEFGSSAQGFEDLKEGKSETYFAKYHKEPKLFPDISSLISKNTKKPYAMMDSSDGLVDCLIQISNKSNVKIDIDYNLIPKKIDNSDFVLFGGEDYSLVVCIDEEDFKNINGLTKIGVCSFGNGVFVDGKEIKYKGFEHFE